MTERTSAWERAARGFVRKWERRPDVECALACGSFVTGHPRPRSDIDLVIVLAAGTKWRERGNARVDGFMVEYFANSARQIRAYWSDEHARHQRANATMFVTGRVLFDKHGLAMKLVREATRWHRRPLPRVPKAVAAATQYAIWDCVDNTLDAIEGDTADVPFQYHHAIAFVYHSYARYLRQPLLPPARI